MAQHVWEAYRKIVAERDGYRCIYCRVPTAATIEHVNARSKAGGSAADNLAIACPWCNTHKKDTDKDEFLAAKGHMIPRPDVLPQTVYEVLANHFGINDKTTTVSTGSTNAKLELKGAKVVLLVRAGSKDEWKRFHLGDANDPKVAGASYSFLIRHYTPAVRKRKAPPKKVWAKRKR